MKFNPYDICMPELCDIVPYQAGDSAQQIEAQFGIRNALKLSSNENLLGPGDKVKAMLTHALGEINFYPDGGGDELKATLAKHYDLSAQQVTLCNGSNEALEFIARCFLSSGKNAICAEHAFAVYKTVIKLSGASAKIALPNSTTDSMPYGHNLEEMLKLVDQSTRLIFIANPNNPTGTWISHSELYRFMLALPTNIPVVIDEAYAEYVDSPDYPNSIDLLSEFDNLIITRTFSKIFGLAGLRVGYTLSSIEIAHILNAIRQPFNVNMLAQKAAKTALSDVEHIQKSREINKQGLQFLQAELKNMGIACLPSCANFVCFEAGNADAVYKGLIKKGVIVRPIANYNLPQYLRVTIGLPEHNERFLEAVKSVLAETL